MGNGRMTTLANRLPEGGPRGAMVRRLFVEHASAQKKWYGLAALSMVAVAATTAATAWLMEFIVDAMTTYESRSAVFGVAGLVALVFAVKGIAAYVQMVALSRAGNRIIADQQRTIYRKLLQHGVSYFSAKESSNLLMRVTNGAEMARRVVDLIITTAVRDTLTLIGLVGVMLYQQPVLSLFVFFIGPAAILGVRRLLARVREIMQGELAGAAEIMKVVQETSRGIQVVKVFSLEDRMADRMDRAVRSVEKRRNAIASVGAATSPLMETLAGFAIAGIVIVSSFSLFGSEPTSAGQLLSFLTAFTLAYEPAKRLSRVRVDFERYLVGVRMMFELLDYEEELVEAPDAAPIPPGPGEVRFDGVTFGYRKGEPVLDGLDLAFDAGRMTALVGPSGGGKSTILNLVMRLYDPTSGRVLIDGHDLRGATFASLRDRISFVGQDTFLFSTTVRENLRLSRPGASDAEIEAAARDANAHDFISKLPKGYDTEVGENGAFLSGGQRQRLSIARAMLRRSEILLLDEATSALDATSETLVREALARLTEGTTTIVIAHRLSTVLEADRIHVIADGRLAESGTAHELLERGGLFRTLFDQQFEGLDEFA